LTTLVNNTLLQPCGHHGAHDFRQGSQFKKWIILRIELTLWEQKMSEVVKAMSKTEVLTSLAEKTGLTRKDVANVFVELSALIQKEIGKKGPGTFGLAGLMKIQVIRKPATKATTRKNPFKPDEMMEVKAKPARSVIKVRALKSLKDMV